MKRLFSLFIFLAAFAPAARAGVFVEPWVGYATGKFEHTVTVGSTVFQRIDQNMSGMGYGVRGGWRFMALAVGAEYQAGSINFKGGGGVEPKDLGAHLGLYFLGGIRAWGTYFFKAKTGSIEGTAVKGGLGYLFLRHVSLNVEYIKYKYNKITLAQFAGTSVGYSGSASALIFSLSTPFSL